LPRLRPTPVAAPLALYADRTSIATMRTSQRLRFAPLAYVLRCALSWMELIS
jgi:hypothetical protein